jgi:hypothetical protein
MLPTHIALSYGSQCFASDCLGTVTRRYVDRQRISPHPAGIKGCSRIEIGPLRPWGRGCHRWADVIWASPPTSNHISPAAAPAAVGVGLPCHLHCRDGPPAKFKCNLKKKSCKGAAHGRDFFFQIALEFRRRAMRLDDIRGINERWCQMDGLIVLAALSWRRISFELRCDVGDAVFSLRCRLGAVRRWWYWWRLRHW